MTPPSSHVTEFCHVPSTAFLPMAHLDTSHCVPGGSRQGVTEGHRQLGLSLPTPKASVPPSCPSGLLRAVLPAGGQGPGRSSHPCTTRLCAGPKPLRTDAQERPPPARPREGLRRVPSGLGRDTDRVWPWTMHSRVFGPNVQGKTNLLF